MKLKHRKDKYQKHADIKNGEHYHHPCCIEYHQKMEAEMEHKEKKGHPILKALGMFTLFSMLWMVRKPVWKVGKFAVNAAINQHSSSEWIALAVNKALPGKKHSKAVRQLAEHAKA